MVIIYNQSDHIGFVLCEYEVNREKVVAVKRVKKSERYISREYQMLMEVKGNEHCVQLLDIFYTFDADRRLTQNFVFEYVTDCLGDYIHKKKDKGGYLPIEHIKVIMKQILKGLAFLHKKNICHRDMKPSNILMDTDLYVKIGDFGGAKILSKDGKNTSHIGTGEYRSPELILCHTNYTCSVDIWSAGCILVEMFKRTPVFSSRKDAFRLLEITSILGDIPEEDRKLFCNLKQVEKLYDNAIKQYDLMRKQHAKMPPDRQEDFKTILTQLRNSEDETIKETAKLTQKMFNPGDFKSIFARGGYLEKDIENAVDLVEKMLTWDPKNRITAKEALNHPFFDDVDDKVC